MRAVQENKKLTDEIAELLRRGLAKHRGGASATGRRRIKLPLVECAHEAFPDEEMTVPEHVTEVLLDQEAGGCTVVLCNNNVWLALTLSKHAPHRRTRVAGDPFPAPHQRFGPGHLQELPPPRKSRRRARLLVGGGSRCCRRLSP